MYVTQKLTYTNRTPDRLLLIIEPWAEEHWIDPDEQVYIEVLNGNPGNHLEIEHTDEGLTVHGWEGTVVNRRRGAK
jgi:hypothetical protein